MMLKESLDSTGLSFFILVIKSSCPFPLPAGSACCRACFVPLSAWSDWWPGVVLVEFTSTSGSAEGQVMLNSRRAQIDIGNE